MRDGGVIRPGRRRRIISASVFEERSKVERKGERAGRDDR